MMVIPITFLRLTRLRFTAYALQVWESNPIFGFPDQFTDELSFTQVLPGLHRMLSTEFQNYQLSGYILG